MNAIVSESLPTEADKLQNALTIKPLSWGDICTNLRVRHNCTESWTQTNSVGTIIPAIVGNRRGGHVWENVILG